MERRLVGLLLCLTGFVCSGQAAAAEPSEPERVAALNQYIASVAEQRWADALSPAQRMVELARSENGEQSRQMAEALIRLGAVQYAVKDLTGAEVSFGTALLIQEKLGGPIDRSLEEPLSGLGYTLAAMGRHGDAVQVLERALLVSQRHNGLFDVSQRALRQQLGNSLSEIDRGLDAEQQFRSILQAAEAAYGAEDVRLAEAQDLVGDWYARWGHFEPARHLYRNAIRLIETKAGAADPRLVNPLRSLGRSYIRELLFANAGVVRASANTMRPLRRERLPAEGEEAIQRAIRVMEAHEARNPLAYRTALIDSGDWFLLKNNPDRALEFYRRALAQPATTAGDAAAAGDPLRSPALLDYELPTVARRYLDRPADKTLDRRLVAEFTVSRAGEVVEPRIVDSDATERMERETLASLRQALYRPRFENGEPVDTPNVRYQQNFKDLKN